MQQQRNIQRHKRVRQLRVIEHHRLSVVGIERRDRVARVELKTLQCPLKAQLRLLVHHLVAKQHHRLGRRVQRVAGSEPHHRLKSLAAAPRGNHRRPHLDHFVQRVRLDDAVFEVESKPLLPRLHDW